PSMEAFLAEMLPRLLAGRATYTIHAHQGKSDLLKKLGDRLRAYAKWLPESSRIVVVIDRDNSDCFALKEKMEQLAKEANLLTRKTSANGNWRVVNRLAIEELEAWFFGEWKAVCTSFPKVSSTIPAQAPYRNPDAVTGGTWEALERVLGNAGYFPGGLRKLELAVAIGKHFDPMSATSPSFLTFRDALVESVS
ncbi:DUF4276 family protein, partial [Rhodopseudomonas palustris]|uniref:DUF4276 family protein n=2 Tax=Rhodopseudomonas TaxID=1073 RepID=UPI0009B9D78F